MDLLQKKGRKIITSISGVSERARNSLEKTGNPGWDKDVVRSVAEHLETQAHVAGKTAFAWQLTDILATDGFFRGDPNTLATLEAATRTGTEGQREAAMKKYEEYAYAYSFSADQGAERAKTRLGLLKAARGEQLTQQDYIPNEGKGEDYRLEANKLISWFSDTANIEHRQKTFYLLILAHDSNCGLYYYNLVVQLLLL